MLMIQQINVRNYPQRLEFDGRMKVLLENPNPVVIIDDEDHFHLNGFVNKHNFRYSPSEYPINNIYKRSRHSECVIVCYFSFSCN